ncbi:hypothetical protein [Pedobacter jeongneungensis]|uniref:hypothetical protein n=1 Tax=Pedobacter jeongneungensis TaxID=947309 RepID=UPI00046A7803|nr:hypothetical protein [Pedobacter jeongneungensis]
MTKVKHNPKVPKRLINQVKKAIAETKMENNQNPENNNQELIILEDQNTKLIDVTDMVPVDKNELEQLIAQNLGQKEEIGALVGLFLNFIPLFKDGVNPLSLVSLIPKLISDPKIKNQVAAIFPIIEKYSS